MRKIKFRAWDNVNNKMINAIFVGLGKVYGMTKTFKPSKELEDVILMQYTGLRDKNGKEIYQGDIIGIEDVYHFIERDGWEPREGNWKIIGKKFKNFTRKEAGGENYIAGYRLKVVRWEKGSCGFEPFSDSEENCGCCGGGYNPNSFEVLGNIYENPELLDIK